MRVTLTLVFSLLGTSGFAHPGHIADVAGHGHWIGLGAIGLAILIGLLGAKKKGNDEPTEEIEGEIEPEEAPA